jgi:hypothetical protein
VRAGTGPGVCGQHRPSDLEFAGADPDYRKPREITTYIGLSLGQDKTGRLVWRKGRCLLMEIGRNPVYGDGQGRCKKRAR